MIAIMSCITFIFCMLWFVLKQKNVQTYHTLIDISFLNTIVSLFVVFWEFNINTLMFAFNATKFVCVCMMHSPCVLFFKKYWNKCLRTPWIVLITLHNNRIINNKFPLKLYENPLQDWIVQIIIRHFVNGKIRNNLIWSCFQWMAMLGFFFYFSMIEIFSLLENHLNSIMDNAIEFIYPA